jgi:hypothetical protein
VTGDRDRGKWGKGEEEKRGRGEEGKRGRGEEEKRDTGLTISFRILYRPFEEHSANND